LGLRSFPADYDVSKVAPTAATPIILLGQPIFSKAFMVFNQEDNLVSIADSFDVSPSPMHAAKNSRTVVLVIGALLFVAALGALLAVIKPLGFIEPVEAAKPAQPVTTSKAAV
jgi:hypothetical protein